MRQLKASLVKHGMVLNLVVQRRSEAHGESVLIGGPTFTLPPRLGIKGPPDFQNKVIRDLYRLFENAAAVSSQIDHQRCHSIAFQLCVGRIKLGV